MPRLLAYFNSHVEVCVRSSGVLCAFNWSSFDLHPVNARIHLFVDQTTHQHQIPPNHEDTQGLKFVLRIALCRLDCALLGGCEDKVGLIVDGSQDALVGTAVYGNDSDNILVLIC